MPDAAPDTTPLQTTTRGQGPNVVLVHSSGIGPGMWRAYQEPLSNAHRVVTPALLGYAPSTIPPSGTRGLAQADLHALTALVKDLQGPVHLVGHSYGGFLAARVALALPHHVATVSLMEPVLFGALRLSGDVKAMADLQGFAELPWFFEEAQAGTEKWFSFFVDYWNGPGAWHALAAPQRQAFLSAGWKVFEEVKAVMHDPLPFEHYRFPMPTLLMRGSVSTEGARRVVDHLASINPTAVVHTVEGHGHMFPVTAWRDVVPQVLSHVRGAP